jgi:Rrf2 family protein
MLHLARHEGGRRRKTREIAEDMAIPMTFLPQILARLVAAGLVDSLAGRGGGYALVRSAGETSLLDVIEAVEGEVDLSECVLNGGPCRWETECAIHRFWSGAQEAFRDRLRAVTFADVAAVDTELAGG